MDLRGSRDAPRRAMVLVALAALVLRLAFVAARDRPPVSDEIDYHRLGWTLASTGRYAEDGVPTAYRPVGYPALVASVYALAGPVPEAVHALQALLDTVSTVLLFLIGGAGPLGLVAAALWAVFPVAVLYTDLLMPETAFTTAILAAAWLTRRGFPSDARGALALGAILGAAALIRPVALLLVLALPLAARAARTSLPRPGLILAGILLLVGPWIARNAIVLGYPGPVTSTGANLLIGKHPNATGGYSPNVPPEMVPREGPEGSRDLAAIASALDYVSEEPGPSLVMGFAGIAHLFGSEGGMTVWALHPDPSDPATRLRTKIRELPWWLHAFVSGASMLAMLAGTLGFARSSRGPARAWFLALLGVLVITHFVFYGGARYHFPLMPFFVLFAAGLLSARPVALRSGGRGQALGVAVACALLLGIWAGEAAVVLRG